MHFFTKNNITKLEKYLGVKNAPGEHEERLWEKVWKYSHYFSKIPGILCVCVGNSLSMNAAHKDSDIDLFIITKNKRIWTSRIFLTILMVILGQRKTWKNHREKFCLSFFITEDAMNFENIKIDNDIYLAYWIEKLKPIINRKRTFENFQIINSWWIYNKENQKILPQKQHNKIPFLKNSKILLFLWDVFENILKFIFLKKTQNSFQRLWEPFWVIINDDMLKFHNKDRREKISHDILKK